MTRSLAMQIACLRHCVAAARQADVGDQIILDAEAGIKSLEWCERNTEIIREVQRLMTDSPVIIAFLRAFKGAEIGMPRCD
jgi:hypothetical protein